MRSLRKKETYILILTILVGMCFFVSFFHNAHAQSTAVKEISKEINSTNERINQLEQEISEYEDKLSVTQNKRRDLQTEISNLSLTAQKLDADLELTENKISATRLTVTKIKTEIQQKEDRIEVSKDVLRESLQSINKQESKTFVEIVLGYEKIDDFWLELDTLKVAQNSLRIRLAELKSLKDKLQGERDIQEAKASELVSLKKELSSKYDAIASNKQQQDYLLGLARTEESNYKGLLSDRVAQRKQFESELADLERRLDEAVNPKTIPTTGVGTLAWPVKDPWITQYFGNTPFATTNAQVYNGSGHNGIDIGVVVGTPIQSAAAGTVVGVGNTDNACPNGSYGKWMLVEHNNGLTTMYAHLSGFAASQGQSVGRGEVVAYSGNTGYSTGPHLHFTVFASDGVHVGTLNSRGCPGAVYTLPLPKKKNAYLNPLSFL